MLHSTDAVRCGLFPSALALLALACPPDVRAQALADLPVTRIERLQEAGAQLSTAPVTRPSTHADLDGPRTLSLTFPRPAAVRDVLALLVRGTPLSLVVDSGIRASFSGQLRDLTVRQALEAILFQAGLDYELRGTVVRVFPRRPATRLYQLDLVPVRRAWRSAPGGGALVSSVESDPYAEVERGVAALLSSEGRHHVDRRAGLVQVTDFTDRLDQVALYLETVQLRAARQVRIEVRLYRVTLPEGSLARDASATPGVVADVRSAIASLEASGSAALVAAPALTAMNNEPAMVQLEEPWDAPAGAPPHARAVSLVVTPQISADGFILLSVVPLVAAGGSASPSDPPASLASDTVVRLREGETVMISGLPSGLVRRTEWVVLLTPRFVTPTRTILAGAR